MGTDDWKFLGAEALDEVVDRLGRKDFGEKWPSPPTEDAVRVEAEHRVKIFDNDPAPRFFPSPPPRQRSVEELIGQDPREIAPTPIESILSPFQQAVRDQIIEDLYKRYHLQKARLGREIISNIQAELFRGTKKAIIIKSDGAKPIPSNWWSGSNARKAIEEGEFRGCKILLRVGETNSSTPSKNNHIVECQKWLENLRRENPDGYPNALPTKGSFEEEAISKFKGLTPYGFRTAWTKAEKAVPRSKTSGWGRPGRKRREPTK